MDAFEGLDGLRLGRHAATKRFTARDQRKPAAPPAGFRYRGTDGAVRDCRLVRSFAALFHERKLIAQGGDATAI